MAKSIKVVLELDDRQFKQGMRSADEAVGRLDNSSRSSGLSVGALAAGLAAAGTAALGLASAVNAARSVEDLGITLETLYGDAERAALALEMVKNEAARLPIALNEIQAGVPALALVEEKLGGLDNAIQFTAGIASSFGMSFQEAATNVQRSLSAGIGAADLFRDKGVKAFLGFQEGAEYTAEQTEEMFLSMFDVVTAANEKAANSMTGQLSMIGDAVFQVQEAIGAAFSESLKEVIMSFNEAFAANKEQILAIARIIGENLGQALKFAVENLDILAGVMAGVFAAAAVGRIVAVVNSIIQLTNALRAAAVAGTILQGVTGVGLLKVAAGGAAAAAAIYGMNELFDQTAPIVEEINDATGDFTDAVDELTESTTTNTEATDDNTTSQQDNADATQSNADATENLSAATLSAAEQWALLSERSAEANEEIKAVNDAYTDYIENLREDVRLAGLSNEEREIQIELAKAYEKAAQELGQTVQELSAENKEKIEAEIRALIESRRTKEEEAESFIKYEQEKQNQLDRTLKRIEDNMAALSAASENAVERMQAEHEYMQRTIDLYGEERAVAEALHEFNEEVSARETELEQEIQALRAKGHADEADKLQAELDAIIEANKTRREEIARTAEATYQFQNSFETGWRKAYANWMEDSANAAKFGTDVFNTFADGLTDAMVRFAETGKLSFKDLINDMKRVIIRFMAEKAVQSFLKFLTGGGGGGGGIFGSIISGVKSIFGFADGGYIPGNKLSLVGEEGPELFNPASSGTIIPNFALGEGLGAKTTNVYYNISAVDAMSFKNLVSRDPEFIYNVTEAGRRRVPQ